MIRKVITISSFMLCIMLILSAHIAAAGAETTLNSAPMSSALDIVGTWQGTDSLGNICVTITADMQFTISHPGCDLLDEEGTYIADDSSITVTFEEGASQIFRYLIAGDTMLLADETLQYPVVLNRIP